MKKLVCIAILLCLALTAVSASAQIVEPRIPAALRDVIAGNTYIGQLTGYASDEAKEHVTLYFMICEQETYTPKEIEALQPGDVIVVGGDNFVIQEIKQDEFGLVLVGDWYSISLYKNHEGLYIAISDTENRYYKNVFGIEIPVPPQTPFLDFGDPEAEKPVELTVKDLLNRYEELTFLPDNTQVSFDENGNLTQIMYLYTPWN